MSADITPVKKVFKKKASSNKTVPRSFLFRSYQDVLHVSLLTSKQLQIRASNDTEIKDK